MTAKRHPRLLRRTADELWLQLHELSIEELTERAALKHRAQIYAPVGPEKVSEPELEALRDSVVSVARRHGFPADPIDTPGFDRELAVALLEHAQLMAAEGGAVEVWSFHALVLLPDVAFWRFPGTATKTANRERTIGSDLTRHVFARAWWRAYLLSNGRESGRKLPELLAVLGEADLDQIQSRRDAYGGSPVVFQAILESWADADTARLARQANLSERDLLRELLKRLRRIGAFVRLDALEPSAAREVVGTVLQEAVDRLSRITSSPIAKPPRDENNRVLSAGPPTKRSTNAADAVRSSVRKTVTSIVDSARQKAAERR